MGPSLDGASEGRALPQPDVSVDTTGEHLVLEPPGPQELHHPRADDGRPRCRGRLGPLLDQERPDAAVPELSGRGQPGGSGAADDHVDIDVDAGRDERRGGWGALVQGHGSLLAVTAISHNRMLFGLHAVK
jgi:hypothetical protein